MSSSGIEHRRPYRAATGGHGHTPDHPYGQPGYGQPDDLGRAPHLDGWSAGPTDPWTAAGRTAPRRRARGRAPFPAVFVVLAVVSVFTFVVVGLGLGGVLFGRGVERGAATAGGSGAAPCELSPDDKEDLAEQAATGTTEPPEPDESLPPVGDPVGAIGGTEAVPDGGELEDVAIWVHPTEPTRSTVIGADKGCNRLFVYDLAGRTLQSLSLGPVTGEDLGGVVNVDVRHGFRLGGRTVDVVVASDQANGALAVWTVNRRTGLLQEAAARKLEVAPFTYGLCLYQSAETGRLYAFVTQEEEEDHGIPGGLLQQWELVEAPGGRIDARKVRELDTRGEAEGCVADDDLGHLYVANHDAGIFRFGAEPTDSTDPVQIDTTGPGGHLVADVEGLALARASGREGWLIASSQGNNSFAVYDRTDGRFIRNFHVRTGTDELVREIDGIDVSTANLGPAFPRGVFVVQDDGQTFKLIPLQEIVP